MAKRNRRNRTSDPPAVTAAYTSKNREDALLVLGEKTPGFINLGVFYPETPAPDIKEDGVITENAYIRHDLLLFIKMASEGKPTSLENVRTLLETIAQNHRAQGLHQPGDSDLFKAYSDIVSGESDVLQANKIFLERYGDQLRRLVPHVEIPSETLLKRNLKKQLHLDFIPDDRCENHMALSQGTSGSITLSALQMLLKPGGSRVVIPAPFFDQFPIFSRSAGIESITVDTVPTGFKLRAEDLEKLIAEKGLGAGDWLLLTNPNNVTIAEYTKPELQAIANVLARTGVRCVCDELYANLGPQPHISLASLSAQDAQGKTVEMFKHVVTVVGNSKQLPWSKRASKDDRTWTKMGVACSGNTTEIASLNEGIVFMDRKVAEGPDCYYNEVLEHLPLDKISAYRALMIRNAKAAVDSFTDINERCSQPGMPPVFTVHTAGSYFACIELSDELCKKTGIENSAQLKEYILAVTGINTNSLQGSGVNRPMVRINANSLVASKDEVENRLCEMVAAIRQGTAAQIGPITVANDRIVTNFMIASANMKAL